MSAPVETLSAALFGPLVGTAFVLHGAEGLTWPVSLARCDETPRATMPGSPRTAFSLELACPTDPAPPFADGAFVLVHAELGEIGPLYVARILPTGYGPGTAVFQIILN